MPSYTEPKKGQAPRVLLLLFGVFVVIGVVVIAMHKNPTTTSGAKSPPAGGKTTTTALTKPTTTAASAKTTTTKTLGATPPATSARPTTTVQGRQVLFDIHGNGDDTIGRFVIDAGATPWDVRWSYNCSKLEKKPGFNYTIVFIPGARPNTKLGPRQTAVRGSGVDSYHATGTFSMTVATQCSWTIEISQNNP